MGIEFGLTTGLVNTKYAPLAALFFHYQRAQTLKPLEIVRVPIKTRDFSPTSKFTTSAFKYIERLSVSF
jgi:hypothetical protein